MYNGIKSKMNFLKKIKKEDFPAILIFFVFFIAYLILSLVKHLHFQTGYDLSIANQIVWGYSHFSLPIMSVHAYAFIPALWDHIEFIYAIISPAYWILGDARMLLTLQVIFFVISGIPILLLCRKYKINNLLSYALLIAYFCFYGVQNALYSDAHSLVFGVSFLAYFIYFLDSKRMIPTLVFFVLTIICKEDMGLLTFLIAFVYFIRTRQRVNIYLMLASIAYVGFILFVYFPHFVPIGYMYANKHGLLSNLNLLNFFDTSAKRDVIFYSFMQYGFLPLLNPLALIPFVGDLGHYFVLGNDTVTSAQSIFLHYRVTDALLLIWPLILVIAKFKKLNNKYLALYILLFSFLVTYMLHSPLTYLSKKWFWTEPSGVKNINQIISYLPGDAYVVTQTNIAAHLSSRKLIVTMWGDVKTFKSNSPCGQPQCAWFKWAGTPKYLLVDTSPEWNIINLLANRPDFIAGLNNMEKAGTIKKYKQIGSATIYMVERKPFP
jgi:uncharacterized membrane protein